MFKIRILVFCGVIKFMFSFFEKSAAIACLPEPACNCLLSRLTAADVFFNRHKVIVRRGNLVYPSSCHDSIFQKILRVILVYDGNSGHDGSAVGH